MSAWTQFVQDQSAAEPEERPRRRWLVAAVLLLLLLIGVGTFGAHRARGRVARVQQLQKEAFAAAPEQRKAKMDQARDEMRLLSGEQKSQLAMAGMQQAKSRMDNYFALPAQDKQRYLDEQIDRSEKRSRERAAGGAPQQRPGNRPPPSAEQTEQRRKERLDRTTPEQRALMDQLREQMTKFRDEMNRRRQQRGLAPANGPGGFGR